MDERLDRIEAKIDKISDKISNIDVTLAKQEISIAEHIRRTGIAEQQIQHIKDDIIPIQKHMNIVQGVVKLFGVLSPFAYAILKFLKKI